MPDNIVCKCGYAGEPSSYLAVPGSRLDPPEYVDRCPDCGSEDFEEGVACDDCGDVYPPDQLRDGICKACRTWCSRCQGTGIASTGPVEGRCGRCNGTGQITEEDCE